MTQLLLSDCLAGKHNDKLNVAICEWRGWTQYETNAPRRQWHLDGYWLFEEQLPSHILGIKALGNCHEAEKRLTTLQRSHYHGKLWKILDEDLIFAPALHRVIAMLLVVKPELFQK